MLATLALVAALAPQDAADPSTKILHELREVMAQRSATAHYRVYAVLRERLTLRDLRSSVEPLARGERQLEVARRLRAFADARQAGLLALLAGFERSGDVQRVEQLWITNSVVFRGSPAAIAAVAALPEVERIGWDPIRAQSEYEDAAATRIPVTYYFQDFEGDGVPPEFSTATTACGFVDVSPIGSASSGCKHLVMASTQDGCTSTASATLTVDLSAATTVQLRYRFKDLNDEFHAGADVLEASDDGGAAWTFVEDLTGTNGLYETREIDLDALGLAYVSDFRLRWSWEDNFTLGTDGFGFDDIELADVLAPWPGPGPEPNLTKLGAPDLWNLGYTGQGILLLNMDSGTEVNHPDLAGRIWTNPADPVDGADNDGNGYIDDVLGWDFLADDNDPDPEGATHGTNTAGIMVGDGSAGVVVTGMAPGASLAIARLSGESSHWLAHQWAISVGVDCSSSSHSYKWDFSPKPDYHMHRMVEEMILAAGIIHANSIGNQGGSGSHPIPFNISAPGLSPSPWRHSVQSQTDGGVSGVMACGGIQLDDSDYAPSGRGPSAWEDIAIYDGAYPHGQDPAYWDYPYGGFGGGLQGLVKPDVVTYTNVTTTTNSGGYASFGGTSAATPHLGGALALLLSVNDAAKPRHVAQALQITAEDLGAPGKDPDHGAGKVRVKHAALRLFHLVNTSDLEPSIGSTITLSMSGFPGDPFVTWMSLERDQLPKIGGGVAGRAGRMVVASSVLDGAGQATALVDLPSDPALVGTCLHFQSLEDNTAGALGRKLLSVLETITLQP